jgi:hypothetical protein
MKVLDDDKWRDSLGLTRPAPGRMDEAKDMMHQHVRTYRGPMAIAEKTMNIHDKKDQLNNEIYELQIAEKEKRDYLRKLREEQHKAMMESNTSTTSASNQGANQGATPLLPVTSLQPLQPPASTTTTTSTTNVAKLNKPIQYHQANIAQIKKELHDELKGRRWRGELSSLRSTVARSTFLDGQNSYGDISLYIEKEKEDRARLGNEIARRGGGGGKGTTTTTTMSSSSSSSSSLNSSTKQLSSPLKPSASFASRTGRVPLYGDVGGGNIMVSN